MGQIKNGLGFHKTGEWGWGFLRLGDGWYWWAMGQIRNGVGVSLDAGGGTGGLWARSGMGLGFR